MEGLARWFAVLAGRPVPPLPGRAGSFELEGLAGVVLGAVARLVPARLVGYARVLELLGQRLLLDWGLRLGE
ncbi:hypothetical protein KYC5002_05110 [Archangium violaceum]|uniref:hypothetical protein n=1 Tax=Archangium violaceum TaxID=83451 RepID=UPI002B2DAB40|nr:hypothetical protein KYC5002_05110 [Archangium gephyra]